MHEALIISPESKKTPEAVHGCPLGLVLYNNYFLWIYHRFVTWDGVAQVRDARASKGAFTKLSEELVLSEHGKDSLMMFKVLLPGQTVYQHIIEDN